MMIILIVFGFLAGLATVLSPCVLPVLPAIFAGGIEKGKYRPIGIVLGLIISFCLFTLSLTYLVSLTGLSANWLRFTAVVLIAFFGLTMLIPSLGNWFSQKTARIASFGTTVQSKAANEGFWGGTLLGAALGLVWTPCAGPILAAVTTLTATQQVTWQTIVITVAYAIGAGIPLFLIAYGSNRAMRSSRFLSQHAEKIRKGFGVLMILTALAVATSFDVAFQQVVINYFPSFSVEDNPVVRKAIEELRPSTLAKPEIEGIDGWINSEPVTLNDLKGKVVLVDFWTYSCINCVRTLPYLTKWYDTYKDKGLVIVGVHTPEFEFEKNKTNVEAAVKRFNIHYPIALDNHFRTWLAFNNHYWPAHYLFDQQGVLHQVHFGEGKYMETENEIRKLLGLQPLEENGELVDRKTLTPETYLGFKRAESYVNRIQPSSSTEYNFDDPLLNDQVGLRGQWDVSGERITAVENGASLSINFIAGKVFLVMSGKSDTPITLELDGSPLFKEFYSNDLDSEGRLFVKEDRMYQLINLPVYGRHTLTIHFPKGISAYAFTFGS